MFGDASDDELCGPVTMVDGATALKSGVAAFKIGDFDTAVNLLEDASRQEETSYDAFVYLGAAYAQQGRHNTAIGALKRACELRPGSAKIHYNLGQAYEAAGVPREAWFSYKKALDIDPNYGLARGALISLSNRLPKLLAPTIQIAA